MRRIVSIWLALGLTLILGVGPALASVPAEALIPGLLAAGSMTGLRSGWTGKADESRLPACCRKGGKHHCELNAMGAAAVPAGERSVSDQDCCPMMPRTLASSATGVAAIVSSGSRAIEFPAGELVAGGRQDALALAGRRDWPKRGPPARQTL